MFLLIKVWRDYRLLKFLLISFSLWNGNILNLFSKQLILDKIWKPCNMIVNNMPTDCDVIGVKLPIIERTKKDKSVSMIKQTKIETISSFPRRNTNKICVWQYPVSLGALSYRCTQINAVNSIFRLKRKGNSVTRSYFCCFDRRHKFTFLSVYMGKFNSDNEYF